MSIIQLLYVSRATVPMTETDLVDIVDRSCRKNARLGITGLLLYGRGNFIQVLEGEATRVDELMEVIKQDPRHKDVEILQNAPIRARLFKQWGMGLAVLHGDRSIDRYRLQSVMHMAERAPRSDPRRVALDILSEFKNWVSQGDSRAA